MRVFESALGLRVKTLHSPCTSPDPPPKSISLCGLRTPKSFFNEAQVCFYGKSEHRHSGTQKHKHEHASNTHNVSMHNDLSMHKNGAYLHVNAADHEHSRRVQVSA